MTESAATNLMPSGTVLGPIGDRVIFENHKIRVWIVSLDAGGCQPWHQHFLPYLIVPLTDGEVKIQFANGTMRGGKDTVGEVRWCEPGEVHELYNLSKGRFENLVIEIKDRPEPTSKSQ